MLQFIDARRSAVFNHQTVLTLCCLLSNTIHSFRLSVTARLATQRVMMTMMYSAKPYSALNEVGCGMEVMRKV